MKCLRYTNSKREDFYFFFQDEIFQIKKKKILKTYNKITKCNFRISYSFDLVFEYLSK